MTRVTAQLLLWVKNRPQWKTPSVHKTLLVEETDKPLTPEDYINQNKNIVVVGDIETNPEETHYRATVTTTDGMYSGVVVIQYGGFLDYRRRKALLKEVGTQ